MVRAKRSSRGRQVNLPWVPAEREERLAQTLDKMREIFLADPELAVRSQSFIKEFHSFIAEDLRSFLTPKAIKAGVRVVEEAKIFGSYKAKDVDVAVVHPINGPLMIIGVRSQMSSVGKNVLTYYQDIVGEAISLQERFPMCVAGYAYVHPLEVKPWQRSDDSWVKAERPNHGRFARLYAAIGGRDDRLFKHQVGSYDHFAYLVVDFQSSPAELRDDVVNKSVQKVDLSIRSFVPRLIETFHNRNLWVEDVFTVADSTPISGSADHGDDTQLDTSLVESVPLD